MQALAREFNASETTFVLPPTDDRATRRLRCFSPTSEVFGAGHNALGAWWAIVARGDVEITDGETRLWQELGSRVLPVDVTRKGGALVRVAMTQAAPVISPVVPDRGALARALGLEADALTVSGLDPQVMSTGATHMLVPTRRLADLARVRVDAEQLTALARPLGCEGCYLFCLDTCDADRSRARAFFPGIGLLKTRPLATPPGPLALPRRPRACAGRRVAHDRGDGNGSAEPYRSA
jgi:PhzF family phenazine biosynthesis protein